MDRDDNLGKSIEYLNSTEKIMKFIDNKCDKYGISTNDLEVHATRTKV
jgi:hypothetical protein